MTYRAGTSFLGLVGAAAAWGWFEAGWVRLRERACPVRGLPAELAGLRVAHLSDFHLGVPSRGLVAVERAIAWVEERRPDLVCVTGDVLTRPAGEPLLRALLARVPGAFVVLGNHDFGIAKDPLAERSAPDDLAPAVLLSDESRTVELRGRRVQVAGVDPRSPRRVDPLPLPEPDRDADLRILLCHYPRVVDRLEPGDWHLVLAGHLHDGQIAIPYGLGKVRLSQRRWTYTRGVYLRPGGTLHVSPGLGTTFVPFRFAARPEATELVLEQA